MRLKRGMAKAVTTCRLEEGDGGEGEERRERGEKEIKSTIYFTDKMK